MKLFRKGLTTFVLLLLVSGGVLAQTSDVPPEHWAYDAVRSLLDRGYLDAEADGLFHGDNPVSRYDLAGVIARMLDDIEEGRVQIGTAADVEMLRRLESEFRAELVQWHDARRELEEAHGQTQRQVAVIDEQLNNILFELELIDAELTELAGRADGHDTDVIALNARLADLSAELAAARSGLQTEIDRLSGAVIDALDAHGVSVDEQFKEQMSAYGRLAQQLADLQARVEDELVPLNNRLSEQGAALFLRLGEMDAAFAEKWDEFAAELDSVRQATADLTLALDRLGVMLTDEYGARLDEQAVGFAQELNQVRSDTERLDDAVAELRAELESSRAAAASDDEMLRAALEEQRQGLQALLAVLSALEEQSTADAERLDNDVAELRAIVSLLDGRLGELQQDLRIVERHTATLTDAVMDVSALADRLRDDVNALSARVNDETQQLRTDLAVVQTELGALQGVLGTSEEQIAALTERVRRDLDEQLALTLAREGQLSRQLAELQAEFASYREKTEQELQSARSMGNIGIGAAILAVVLGLAR